MEQLYEDRGGMGSPSTLSPSLQSLLAVFLPLAAITCAAFPLCQVSNGRRDKGPIFGRDWCEIQTLTFMHLCRCLGFCNNIWRSKTQLGISVISDAMCYLTKPPADNLKGLMSPRSSGSYLKALQVCLGCPSHLKESKTLLCRQLI